MRIKLTGEANDYVGKGMAGGEVVIVPPPGSRFAADEASLVGNTCLYGATGGRLFVNGRAGALGSVPLQLCSLHHRCLAAAIWAAHRCSLHEVPAPWVVLGLPQRHRSVGTCQGH